MKDSLLTNIKVELRRTAGSQLKLRAFPGRLLVTAPASCSEAAIYESIANKSAWILKHCQQQPCTIMGEKVEDEKLAIGSVGHRKLCAKAIREVWTTIVGDRPVPMSINSMASAWGRCHSSGRIEFCWQLGRLPRELIAYVVYHELAHLVHMNHSKAFWEQLTAIMPEARRLDKRLKTWALI